MFLDFNVFKNIEKKIFELKIIEKNPPISMLIFLLLRIIKMNIVVPILNIFSYLPNCKNLWNCRHNYSEILFAYPNSKFHLFVGGVRLWAEEMKGYINVR